MKLFAGICLLFFSLGTGVTFAQFPQIDPQILTKPDIEGKVTRVEVAARFVTTIRLPEAVNSVVVGDPSKFQIEHSEREPKLVFVKTISAKPNNRMELTAVINGLGALREQCDVGLITDSQYLKQGITEYLPRWKTNGWRTSGGKPVQNQDLWQELDELVQRHLIHWVWVAGHADNTVQNRCDALALAAAREQAVKAGSMPLGQDEARRQDND